MSSPPLPDQPAARLSHLLRHSPVAFRDQLARRFRRLPPHERDRTIRFATRAWRSAPRFSTAVAAPRPTVRTAYFNFSATNSAAAAMRHQAYIERDSACIHSRGTIADNLHERTRLWSELGYRAIHRAGHLRAHADTDQRLRDALRSHAPDPAADPLQVRTTLDTHDAYRATLQRIAEDIDLDGDHGIHDRPPRSSVIQYRLILELPHQLDPHQAAATLDAWCERELTQHDIAFHAAVHQPEHGNDPRNWHAHVVFPTILLQREPATGGWTFEHYPQKFPPSLRPPRLQILRRYTPPGASRKGTLLKRSQLLHQLRSSWVDHINQALERTDTHIRYVTRSPDATPSGAARHHGPSHGHGWPLNRPELRLAAGLAVIGFHPASSMALRMFGPRSRVPAPGAVDPQTSQYDPVDAAVDSFIDRTAQLHQALLRLWRQERKRLRRRATDGAQTELHDNPPNLALGHAAQTVATLFRTGVLANLAADGSSDAREIRQTARAWRTAVKPYHAVIDQARLSTSPKHARHWKDAHRRAARELRDLGLRDFRTAFTPAVADTLLDAIDDPTAATRLTALERRQLELATDPDAVSAAAAARTQATIDSRTGEFDAATPTLAEDLRTFLETAFRAAWLRRERAVDDPDRRFADRSTDPHWTLGLPLPERADLLARKSPDVTVTAPPAAPGDDPPDFRTHCAAVLRYVREHRDAQAVQLARDVLADPRAALVLSPEDSVLLRSAARAAKPSPDESPDAQQPPTPEQSITPQ